MYGAYRVSCKSDMIGIVIVGCETSLIKVEQIQIICMCGAVSQQSVAAHILIGILYDSVTDSWLMIHVPYHCQSSWTEERHLLPN